MGRQDFKTETLLPTRRGGFFDEAPAHTLRAEGFDASEDGTGRGTPLVPIAFSCKDHGADAGAVSPTLRAMEHAGSHANAGGQVAIAFNWQAAGNQTTLGSSEDSAATLSKSTTQAVANRIGVRRLTPKECERLQGWPDGHTRFKLHLNRVGNAWKIADRSRIEQADGPRYRQCGNGITATVAAWIGRRCVEFATQK